MDTYLEFLVQKDKEAKESLYKALSFIITLLLCIVCFAFLGTYGLLGSLLIIYLDIKIQDYFSIEYEYCIISGDIDIDKIFSKKRRKKYISIEADSIEIVAPVTNPEIQKELKGNAKKYYACKNKDNNNIAVSGYSKKGGKILLILENNEKILETLKKTMPRKVINE